MNDQVFEKWLEEALAADITAPEDFTARVMERVATTPQELPRKNTVDKRKLKRTMTALAACAAIVVLIPVGMLMMPKGEKAPAADCAAPEVAMDDAMADMEYFAADEAAAGSDSYPTAEEREMEAVDANNAPEMPAVDNTADGGEMQYTNTDEKAKEDIYTETGIVFYGDEAKMVQAALMELGIGSSEWVDGWLIYHLTENETTQIREMLPELIDAEGAVALTLEVVR